MYWNLEESYLVVDTYTTKAFASILKIPMIVDIAAEKQKAIHDALSSALSLFVMFDIFGGLKTSRKWINVIST